ncbi:MAG: tRNA pseudouridine(38-40) synthase TruA [Bacteroidales bacterium]|nr:tRNA pseudouridine(38-40) synthase TruA [Bacteroidales bacterium]
MRYFIELCFKGTRFHGWQVQSNAISVQGLLNHALSVILKETIETVGAGRTDAGVHASFYTAHFDVSKEIASEKKTFIKSLNAILPLDISILNYYRVKPEAHARYSAIERTYQYTVLTKKDPFNYEFGWYCKKNPEIAPMNEAARLLINHNDFKCFSKLHSNNKTDICRIYAAEWQESPDKLVFSITADRFLRNMVRAIVGTMIDIGIGRTSIKEFEMILKSRDRSSAGLSAPACGLVLTNIRYYVDIKLNV